MSRARSLNSQSSVGSDQFGDNGLILSDIYLPIELIQRIFCFADEKTLLNCQRVCKQWNEIIVGYVWRKKAETKLGCKFSENQLHIFRWQDLYLICAKNIFDRNLLRNHSGEEGLQKYWKIMQDGGDGWIIECPPVGCPPLPQEPEFENKQHCFVTSYFDCYKEYVIDLIKEGFSANILDNLQPQIEISEWYSSRWDCAGVYKLIVRLEDQSGEKIDEFNFKDILEGERQNVWLNVKHEFQSCGRVLRPRFIRFIDGGRDRQFWAGHYGPKMAGAYVKVKFPHEDKKTITRIPDNCKNDTK